MNCAIPMTTHDSGAIQEGATINRKAGLTSRGQSFLVIIDLGKFELQALGL